MTTYDAESPFDQLVGARERGERPVAPRADLTGADLAALISEVERLRGQVNAVKKIIRSPGITTVKGSPADRIMRALEVRK